ncbi:phosphonate C-P lyase system protein PhnH [Sulfitobacter sp. HNIBRBA3233]|uniref:phosphonate C-P lyase system protein PhnH n=1 Tax=Sulfitobacter marinivivus TaxID=3158558 RepID=UPI0032DFB29B
MQAQTLEGGFAEPATQAAGAFRAVMEAMARPGTIHDITGAQPPAPLSRAAGAVILTLCDTDTPLYLAGDADCRAVRDWIAFHTGAPFTGRSHCTFAIGTWEALMPLSGYPVGTAQYPDRSATLIVETERLAHEGTVLRGPGIRDNATLSLPDAQALRANHALFPRGLDFIWTCDGRIAALPRSTQICHPDTEAAPCT